VPTMLGIIPYAGVSFFTNENMKKYLSDKGEINYKLLHSNIKFSF